MEKDGENNNFIPLINEGLKYYGSGELLYEGKYLNGEMKKGKEYNKYGVLIYQGDYLHGKRSGKGKEFYAIWEIKI